MYPGWTQWTHWDAVQEKIGSKEHSNSNQDIAACMKYHSFSVTLRDIQQVVLTKHLRMSWCSVASHCSLTATLSILPSPIWPILTGPERMPLHVRNITLPLARWPAHWPSFPLSIFSFLVCPYCRDFWLSQGQGSKTQRWLRFCWRFLQESLPQYLKKKTKKKTLNVFFCRATQNSNFVFFLCGLTAMFLNTCVVHLHLFLLFSYRWKTPLISSFPSFVWPFEFSAAAGMRTLMHVLSTKPSRPVLGATLNTIMYLIMSLICLL